MRILEMSLQASAIVLFVAILRALALNKLPKRAFVALDLLAAARMLLPLNLPFRYGAGALLARKFPPLAALFAQPGAAAGGAQASTALRTATAGTGAIAISGAGTSAAGGASPGVRSLLQAISPWRIVWLAGLIACALALLLPHLRWRRIYARALPLRDANVDRWLREHPLRRQIRVRISDEIPAPLTRGILRPEILLPRSFDRSDASRLHPALLHEFAHIRHFDAAAKLALAAALCAHWFNPLAWLLFALANRDIELACDEAALRDLDEAGRRNYARALLELAALQSGLPGPLSSGFAGKTIEERIGAIMKYRNGTRIAAIAAALLIGFAALAFATGAEEAAPSSPANPEIEALMFDGWENLSLGDYRARVLALNSDPDSLKGEENYNNPRYTNFLRFVLEPLTEGEWTGNALYYEHTETTGRADPDSGESGTFDFQLRCDVPDASALTAGEFRDKLAAALDGMEDIDPLTASQEVLNDRAEALCAELSDEAVEFQIEAERRPDAPLAEALLFDGWEQMRVRDYAALIAQFPQPESSGESGLSDEYLQDVYLPLRANPDSPWIISGGSVDAATGETLMNYEVRMTIADPDRLTVGNMRDALRGVREGLEGFDCESATQGELQSYVMELAERWSDGESIAFDILAELPGADSPYADPQTSAQLSNYAPLGLEFEYFFGSLSMRFRGEEIRAVIDPEAGITIANSAGPEGLASEGPFLLVEYEDGSPSALRRISAGEYAELSDENEAKSEVTR